MALRYTSFKYTGLTLNASQAGPCDVIGATATLANTGGEDALLRLRNASQCCRWIIFAIAN